MIMAETNFGTDVESQKSLSGVSRINDHHRNHETRLTLEQFRVLVGIPQDLSSTNENGTLHPSRIPPSTILKRVEDRSPGLVALKLLLSFSRSGLTKKDKAEVATSIYWSLRREEADQHRLFHFYNFITYACLILQLVIASALIIIGAIPNLTLSSGSNSSDRGNRIAVAVLGAVTGLLTGVLSLLKGQGMPNRFLQFAGRLRQIRDKIEFKERTLRANLTNEVVTYQDVLDIWQEYETVFKERDINRPDAWATMSGSSNSQDTNPNRKRARSAESNSGVSERGAQNGEIRDEQRKEQQ